MKRNFKKIIFSSLLAVGVLFSLVKLNTVMVKSVVKQHPKEQTLILKLEDFMLKNSYMNTI